MTHFIDKCVLKCWWKSCGEKKIKKKFKIDYCLAEDFSNSEHFDARKHFLQCHRYRKSWMATGKLFPLKIWKSMSFKIIDAVKLLKSFEHLHKVNAHWSNRNCFVDPVLMKWTKFINSSNTIYSCHYLLYIHWWLRTLQLLLARFGFLRIFVNYFKEMTLLTIFFVGQTRRSDVKRNGKR